ncbi:Response regulator receiver domain-containing protein [Catalinimonas alkaloidigena]|uniref:Response regulator receiver domain-containing protein n=1 Tax=Catalinimonas alkaloidigena TaxID=1075417 RepID=A0A1G9DG06_9BACT|nr:response regulator [Catalinimonas alkaloidigena]SDK62799.1 Response regulator receiver domain-containing protein [Catalinimonas alkaloidigena]
MKKIQLACIIDDDPVYVYGIKKLMKLVDFCENMLVFKNGAEALKYLTPVIQQNDTLPDIILLDINMPIMDGWQFLDEFIQIKPKSRKITIYMVSSSVDPDEVAKAQRYSEVSDYVVKPVQEDSLRAILESV